MTTRVDRSNRVLLGLLGTALLAAGGLGVARSLGWIGPVATTDGVLPPDAAPAWAGDWWFWPAVAAIAFVIALLCLAWLVAQASTERLRHLEVDPSRAGGDTWLRAAPIAEAVEGEVTRIPGVDNAKMQLLGTPGRHRHRLVVSLNDRADIDSVRAQLTAHTIPNVHQALDFDDTKLDIELVLASRDRPRPRPL